MKSKDSKNILVLFIGLFTFIMVAGGVSYAYFVYNKDVALADLTSGSINISFNKTSNTSSIVSTQPISDDLGKNHPTYLEFSVNGTADIEDILYELEIVKDDNNTLDDQYIKLYLTEVIDEEEYPLTAPVRYSELYDSLANNGKGMYQELVTGNDDGTSKNIEHQYRLRTWVSSDYHDATGGDFSYSIYLYAENINSENYRKVTFKFDDERVEALSKYVELGKGYGSLPTLYKEGYTFLGWNGKNMFNEDNYLNMNDYPFRNNSSNYSYSKIILNSNTDYKISVIRYNDFDGTTTYLLISNHTSINANFSAIAHINTPDNSLVDFKYTTSMDGLLYIGYATAWTVQSYLNKIWQNTDVQIEEGSVATPYEPYYVTSDTKVTRWNTEMVLKAKYELNVVNDLSRNNYEGSANGVTLVTDTNNNKAFSFDGVDDYIEVPTLPSSINWHDGFVVEFKAKWNALNSWSRIFDFGNGSPSNNIIVYNYDTSDILRFGTYNVSTSQLNIIIDSPAGLQTLHEYRIEYNNSSSEIKVYRDNILINTISHSMTVNNVKRTSNYVGKSNWDSRPTFSGLIYYLKISQIDGTPILWYDANSQ